MFRSLKEDTSIVPIVIVDDVEEDLLLAERIIRQCKILNPVKLLKTGEECIAYFQPRQNSDRPPQCLLLLDLLMPTSGLFVLRRLRDQKLGHNSILVMISGLTDIKAIQEGYQLGARTFLVKPIQPEDVVGLINSLKDHFWIEQRSDGHLLHWAALVSTPPGKSATFDTTQLSRLATVSA